MLLVPPEVETVHRGDGLPANAMILIWPLRWPLASVGVHSAPSIIIDRSKMHHHHTIHGYSNVWRRWPLVIIGAHF